VVLDADIVVTPGVLRALVPHFESPRVGAVTGNPRVSNRGSLLRNLQTLEFASIVSVQRRAQRIWGRVLTVSARLPRSVRPLSSTLGSSRPTWPPKTST
jgi:biofilm PGA synthesis N-glycosyltransferase PgaC